MEKIIEVNLGIGINMFFPETVKIVIDVEDDNTEQDEENN